MKNLKYIGILFLLGSVLSLQSCRDSIDDLVTENAVTGGLVNVETPLLSYVIGTPEGYNVRLKVFQGSVTTGDINVMKSFTNAAGESTNEVLLKAVNITENETHFLEFDVSFDELRDGLLLNGAPIPASDDQYAIGDFWELAFVASTSEGNSHRNRATTKIAVSGKYAGVYTVGTSSYIHPTAGDQGGWNGATVIIESVNDAFSYHILANGPWDTGVDPDNEFYFVVNADNTITVPKEWNGELQTVWGGADELANCDDDPGELPDVCGNTNFVDPTEGAEKITMSHGYIRDSGTRQFFYELIKNQ